jgi:hypothetical protein
MRSPQFKTVIAAGLGLMFNLTIIGGASGYALNSLGSAGGWDDINKRGPITTVIDEHDFTNDVSSTAAISTALMNAYSTWSDVPGATKLNFEHKSGQAGGNYDAFDGNSGNWFDGTSATLDQDANWRFANIVMGGWLDESYFLNLGSENILAVTWTGRLTGDGSRKPAWHSEIFFNDGFLWGTDNSCTVNDPLTENCFDIETVFLHELGHAIGFDHEETDPDSVMAPYYGGTFTILSALDMDGAVALYGGSDGGGGSGGGGNKGGGKGNNGRRINSLSADFNEIEVPEPSTLVIFGLGLAGLGFMRRKKNQ